MTGRRLPRHSNRTRSRHSGCPDGGKFPGAGNFLVPVLVFVGFLYSGQRLAGVSLRREQGTLRTRTAISQMPSRELTQRIVVPFLVSMSAQYAMRLWQFSRR